MIQKPVDTWIWHIDFEFLDIRQQQKLGFNLISDRDFERLGFESETWNLWDMGQKPSDTWIWDIDLKILGCKTKTWNLKILDMRQGMEIIEHET